MDAAWHPDPGGRHELRYWDGSSWTDHVSDNGVTSLDPLPPYPGAAQEGHESQGSRGAHAAGQDQGHDQAHDQGTGQGAGQGTYEAQDSPVADLSTEPTRFAPGGALPSYDQQAQQAGATQDQPPAYQPWGATGAETAGSTATEPHEAETMPPSSEPIFASMGERDKPDLEREPEPAAEPASPSPDESGSAGGTSPEPASSDPDAWVRGLLADGEQLVDSVGGDERDVTVTSHRVVVREHAGGWTAFRLDRVSHVDVIGDGTGREAVQVHVAAGPSFRVTGDTEQVAALVRALTT